ncbi:MAG: CGGC domain-containing protein [Oscillospiraceae bacterium]|jgi:predicted metal-binding protein|nr:CGGC domain-containing protein [Oscillospiraceae bacterium]
MKNIAILTCRKAADVCTGAACMKAFNEKTGSFSAYGEPARLVAFMQCNGCGSDPTDENMAKKIARLEKDGADCVHIGICSEPSPGVECEIITQIAGIIETRGIAVVRGTHA